MAEMREDRGELDLTLQVEKLKKRVEEAEGELTIIKGIGMNSPEMKEKDRLIQELRMRIRDMLLISEQHRSILGDEIKREEHFIKSQTLIDIIDNIERLVRALRKHIIRK